MDLVWSDGLLEEARRTRDEVAGELAAMGVRGDLVLTGASSIPGVLTQGDVDLHLRVAPADFEDAVERLSRGYEVGSTHAWAATLAVFDVRRARATGLAVTPAGSEHDVRFTSTWEALRRRPDLLDAYNALKQAADGSDRYEEAKSAFFTSVSATAAVGDVDAAEDGRRGP